MDNSPEPNGSNGHDDTSDPANGGVDGEFDEDEAALRDVQDDEVMETDDRSTEEDIDVMRTFATQTQTIPQDRDEDADLVAIDDDDDDEPLQEVSTDAPPPPVFRPLMFNEENLLEASVKKRMKKSHEAVLEEQPKWSLLAKVLKEIEDTIARVAQSHAGKRISFRPVSDSKD